MHPVARTQRVLTITIFNCCCLWSAGEDSDIPLNKLRSTIACATQIHRCMSMPLIPLFTVTLECRQASFINLSIPSTHAEAQRQRTLATANTDALCLFMPGWGTKAFWLVFSSTAWLFRRQVCFLLVTLKSFFLTAYWRIINEPFRNSSSSSLDSS